MLEIFSNFQAFQCAGKRKEKIFGDGFITTLGKFLEKRESDIKE